MHLNSKCKLFKTRVMENDTLFSAKSISSAFVEETNSKRDCSNKLLE